MQIAGSDAVLEPIRGGMTQRQQNQLHLDAAPFFEAGDLEVRAIAVLPSGDVRVDYAIHHPFPASDLSQPPSAANRADLGFTGQLLILTDLQESQVANRTFFTDVKLNTDAVLDPDGFLRPGGLLQRNPALNANTFPYKLIVDESRNNREGVSNAGNMRGNYNRFQGGWQRPTMDNGGVNNGWVGYDFLHQGQTALGSFTLSRFVLNQPGGFGCELALLLKWVDPRGVGGKASFLPEETFADPHLFAYRLPYAALDVSAVTAGPLTGTLSTIEGSQGRLRVEVRDWDAASAEVAEGTVGESDDVGVVQLGAAGNSVVTAHFPSLGSAPFTAVAEGAATGLPGSEVQFDVLLTNVKGTAASGVKLGLVRVVDRESLLERETYTFGIDPVTLKPESELAPALTTYRPYRFTLPAGFANILPPVHMDMTNGEDLLTDTERFAPGMAVDGNTLYVLHTDWDSASSLGRQTCVNVSLDAGETWTGPQSFAYRADFLRRPDAGISAIGNGEVILARTYFLNGQYRIKATRLDPGGDGDLTAGGETDIAYDVEDFWITDNPLNDNEAALLAVTLNSSPEPDQYGLELFRLTANGSFLHHTLDTSSMLGTRSGTISEPSSPRVAVGYDGATYGAFSHDAEVLFTARPQGATEFPQFQESVANGIGDFDPIKRLFVPRSGIPVLIYKPNNTVMVAVRNGAAPSPWTTVEFPNFLTGDIDPESGALYLCWPSSGELRYQVSQPDLSAILLGPVNVLPPPSRSVYDARCLFSRTNGKPQITLCVNGGGTDGAYPAAALIIRGD